MTDSLLAGVETRMVAMAAAANERENAVCRAAIHHLSAGGSRLRARLCLHAGTQLGMDTKDAITLASICELLHNASLIQDDLIDRAPTRRGLPSVWAAFDDATAVCAGDLLLSGAFALVGELHSAPMLSAIIAMVHRRTRDVILGQGVEQSSHPATLEGYEAIAIGKSASLLSLPLELPLLVSGNPRFLATALLAAQAFAAAYQMLDDLADYSEDVRNGALNAVSVAQAANLLDFHSASTLVCSRAEELLQSSISYASTLPMDCGAGLVEYAGKMRLTVHERRQSIVPSADPLPAEPLRHAG